MPFIGTQPEVGGYSVLDALTASATANYTLQKDSANFVPSSANQLLVSLNGVIQKPGSSFVVSGSTLTFKNGGSDQALTSSDSIDFIIAMGEPLLVGVPSDGTVTPAKLSTGGPSWDGNSNFIVGSSYIRSDSTSISSISATTIATHAIATYRSVNYNVQITQGSSYHSTEINVIHDGTTAYITEYGTLFSGSSLATFDATISSGNLLLQITMGSSSSATIKVMSTATSV